MRVSSSFSSVAQSFMVAGLAAALRCGKFIMPTVITGAPYIPEITLMLIFLKSTFPSSISTLDSSSEARAPAPDSTSDWLELHPGRTSSRSAGRSHLHPHSNQFPISLYILLVSLVSSLCTTFQIPSSAHKRYVSHPGMKLPSYDSS